MPDFIEDTLSIEDHIKELHIKSIRERTRQLNPIGECYWCEEPFDRDSKKLFCDSDCATDWEKSKK